MASNTKQTEFRRKQRAKKAGKDRKKAEANHGSTPAFAIHTDEAHKNAPAAQLPKKQQG